MRCIRAKFERGEEVKYISHLDLMKTFERALRRSRIPIAYSQGFNPHPRMVFGLPLSVGITSSSEYADFEIDGDIEPEDFKNTLNSVLPKGLKILDSKIKEDETNIMASMGAASYDIFVSVKNKFDADEFEGKLGLYLNRSEIIISKETKGKIKEVNIRPMIHKIEVSEYKEGVLRISVLLSAGSKENLKPDALFQFVLKEINTDFELIKIHRTALYISKDNKILDPLLKGE